MKKIILLASLISSVVLFNVSCQKNQIHPTQNAENQPTFDFRTDEKFNDLFKSNKVDETFQLRINNSKIIEIANIQDEEFRKLAVATLNSEEKVDFWNYIIEYHIENDHYTNEQKKLMTALKNATVKKEFFENKNLSVILNSVFIPLIKEQLNNAGISDAKMSAAFADGRLIYIAPVAQRPGPGGQKLNCDCSPSTIFTMCSNCKSTDNCTQVTNCGFMFGSNCDGLCPKYLPTNYPL